MYSSDAKIANATISNEKNVTAEDILDEGDRMWIEAKGYKLPPNDTAAVESCMGDMRRNHKEFCTSYPIVMRYMVQFHQYHHNAFKKYLSYIKTQPWKSEDEWLDSQATYVVMLYKELHPRWNRTEVSRLQNQIKAILKAESEHFKEKLNESEKEVLTREKRLRKESKEELIAYFKGLQEAKSNSATSNVNVGNVSNADVSNVDVSNVDVSDVNVGNTPDVSNADVSDVNVSNTLDVN